MNDRAVECEKIKNFMPIIAGKLMFVAWSGAKENDGKCFVAEKIL